MVLLIQRGKRNFEENLTLNGFNANIDEALCREELLASLTDWPAFLGLRGREQ